MESESGERKKEAKVVMEPPLLKKMNRSFIEHHDIGIGMPASILCGYAHKIEQIHVLSLY